MADLEQNTLVKDKTLFIIEDDKPFRERLTTSFQRKDFTVTAAASKKEALDVLAGNNFNWSSITGFPYNFVSKDEINPQITISSSTVNSGDITNDTTISLTFTSVLSTFVSSFVLLKILTVVFFTCSFTFRL